MEKQKIIFIINPISGVIRKNCIEDQIIKYLDIEKYNCQIFKTDYAKHAIELAKKAVDEKADIIVAVGGDGSINEIINGMKGSDTKLAIIPLGSGNGLARFLKIPLQVKEAIHLINRGNTKSIDTISINDIDFVSIAGLGFDALVAKKFAKYHKRGFWSYFKIATREYQTYRPKKYTLHINGEVIITRALMIVFANSDQFGYNTAIAPDAKIDDGLMDVCIVKKIPMYQTPFFLHMLFMKQLDKTSYIDIIKTKEVSIERKKNRVVNIDGEPIKLSKDLDIKVNHLALKVIVP